jgi:uncharacterized protein YndB with AHSA1/START domain
MGALARHGASVDAMPGGFFTIDMANGKRPRGQFLELVENVRVVFTFGWIDHPGLPPGSSTIEVDLETDGDSTVLTLTHRDLPAEEVEMHTMGWNYYVPRLAAAAEGNDPGPDPGLG